MIEEKKDIWLDDEQPVIIKKYDDKYCLLSEGCGCCTNEIEVTKESVEKLIGFLEDQLETCNYLLDCVL